MYTKKFENLTNFIITTPKIAGIIKQQGEEK